MNPLLLLDAQRQAALVELLDDFLERLGAEVRDRQQVVFRLLHELTDRVDTRALQAVGRRVGKSELLDRQVEIGRSRRRRRDLTELEAAWLLRQVGDQVDELAQR